MVELMQVRPVTLTGQTVRLEPLSLEHVPGLAAIGLDDSIWQYMVYGLMHDEADVRGWVRAMLKLSTNGTDVPFAVIDLRSNCVAGATRYMEIRPDHRGLEIGGTWYGAAYRRTRVNTESKFLLLQHAFETLHCIRVQLKTDSRNERSQRAIERLGAVREGTLRNHLILPDGHVRDSIYYSILDSEWPAVKVRLQDMMDR
ncbi:MAG TPA: GNAT family protein [Anaerolineales bacterium]